MDAKFMQITKRESRFTIPVRTLIPFKNHNFPIMIETHQLTYMKDIHS